ncbi:hypothetical protein ORI20_12150 [Mycobacterium sp. CVI_P3]|uniref:Uncharacterized protein n=1 Tax=Mycobacterium pinniadriaticum TaxID=2994102 RepID=A0ABT3SD81_9MYCO|nr:hypothetical protein [Mycobacterium pinniadriaticum]MCX2931033.1 hypothetical protein [Mycobacterium pinniadriaticum]MCX2937457.1 hypothetical protein [Mycobacterium pinniadriaticum]
MSNNTIASRIGRIVALPIIAGGIALGLAATANAADAAVGPDVRSGMVAAPEVTSQPAPEAIPGSWYHRHKVHLYPQSNAAQFTPPASK